jgi:hypothetical protein
MALSVGLSTGGVKTPTSATNTTTTTNKSADLSLIRGVVSDVLGFKAKGIEYDAAASAQKTTAAGYDAEIASYDSSGRLSNMYAAYSKAAGDIYEIQGQRETLKTVGTQRAGLAGSGFSDSEDIVRSTLQKGYLANQLLRTQSLYDQAGYLEQASASTAQSTAAGKAKQAALDTADVYSDAATTSRTYATNATTGLSGYLAKFNTTTTAEGLLSGKDIGTDLATAPKEVSTSSKGVTKTEEPVNQYTIKSATSESGTKVWRASNLGYDSL